MLLRRRRSLALLAVAVALSLVAAPAAPAEAPSTLPARTERLAQVGRLWGFVRYLHPSLAYREIDWDAALVRALPRVAAAESVEQYEAAVQEMLGALDDPVTRVVRTARPGARGAAPVDRPLVRPLDRSLEGALLLDLGAVYAKGQEALQREIGEAQRALAPASAVIVDLRAVERELGSFWAERALGMLQGSLVARPCRAPSQRYLLHSGYRPQSGTTSGGYWSGFVVPAADTFAPQEGAEVAPKRVVFLLAADSIVPALALALQAAGDARIVAEGEIDETGGVAVRQVRLGDALAARVRVSELMPMPGWPGLRADVTVPAGPGSGEAALAAALSEVAEARRDEGGAAAELPTPAPLPEAIFRPDRTYADMTEPDLAHRWLAVIRAWNVIHWFYPYLHLISNWDAVLPELLERMERAESGEAYAVAIAEMMARVADGHTSVSGHPALAGLQGAATVPLSLRWIEGAPVVVAIRDEAARQAGVEIGDAVLAVDGEPAAARLERLRRWLPGSTDEAVVQRATRFLLRGADGSTAVIDLEGIDGTRRRVRLARSAKRLPPPPPEHETVRILPNNVGYADLTRLTPGEVDAMFETLKGTRALVFDMRGYPNGTAWSIAPRINTRKATVGAQFRRAQVSAFSEEEGQAGYFFSQPLPPNHRGLPLYDRPIVMLIDERAISQSEHTGLFFEAANGTRFIGTPTAGANGDVTSFRLPGGIFVTFTGHDVRHADGRQLQRIGLVPDVHVAPTRAGLRAGRDEVLERALQDLEERLAAGPEPSTGR